MRSVLSDRNKLHSFLRTGYLSLLLFRPGPYKPKALNPLLPKKQVQADTFMEKAFHPLGPKLLQAWR